MDKSKISFCEIPWYESLKTKEEKDAYCIDNFGISFDQYLELIQSDLPIKETYSALIEK